MSNNKAIVEAIKHRLSKFLDDQRELENQYERLEYINNKMIGIGSPGISDMPRNPSPSNDRLTNALAAKQEIEKKIGFTLNEHSKERLIIEELLTDLESDERAVIRMRYIDCIEWKTIVKMLYGKNEDFCEKENSYERRMYREQGTALLGMAKKISESKELEGWLKITTIRESSQKR